MKRAEAVLGVLGVGAILAIVWDPFIGSFLNRERNRNEARGLHASVNVGMTAAEVADEIKSGRYPHLTFYQSGSDWVATTPEEFGAQNWIVVITVVKGQVAKVLVRTSDSGRERPPDAPLDKGANGRPKWDGPSNNGLHQTGREGAAVALRWRPVVEARPAGEAKCSAGYNGRD